MLKKITFGFKSAVLEREVAVKIFNNADTYVTEDQLGPELKAYRRTIATNKGDIFINNNHRLLSTTPMNTKYPNLISYQKIQGWLTIPDALKLYEMAYFSQADVLEIGCYQGLSTAIMAGALRDANNNNLLVTVDISKENTEITIQNLSKLGLIGNVDVRCVDATALYKELINKKYKFNIIFVDHSHTYKDVLESCKFLPLLLQEGGFVIFHDYSNLAGNTDGNNVYIAVKHGLCKKFIFHGVFGCSGLFRLQHKV